MPERANQPGLTRRDMLARLFRPVQRAVTAAVPATPAAATPPAPLSHIAVIAGRHCLAYQGIPCTLCVDRCPVPGALRLEDGLPRVEPALCTGCDLCRQVCPSPEEAIRLVVRPPGLLPS